MGKSEYLHRGSTTAILAAGSMAEVCKKAFDALQGKGIDVTFVNARFIKPLDTGLLEELAADHRLLVTVEENVRSGGFGESVAAYIETHHPSIRVKSLAVPDIFVEQGSVERLREKVGLTPEAICRAVEQDEDREAI